MAMLDIVVILKDDCSSFERLLASVRRQTAEGMNVTAVTQKPQDVETLREKYSFRLVEAKSGLMDAVNDAVKSTASQYAMIAAADQMFEVDFYETVSAYFGGFDVIALNISRLHRSGNFYRIFPTDEADAKTCLLRRPCVYGWIISADVLRKNTAELKSLALSDQLDFINGCLAAGKKSCYIPLSKTYIDDMTLSSEPSFTTALSKGEYKNTLVRQSAKDCFEILTKTKFYKNLGKTKRLIKRIIRRLLRMVAR